MYQVILFDLGNVILPFDPRILARKLTAYSPYSEERILGSLWHPALGTSLETGQIGPREFFEQVCRRCRLRMGYGKFMEAFNSIFREDPEVIKLLSKLKARYPIGLISNTNAAHMDHIKKNFTFVSCIDEMILSHEVGLRKPDPAIYWHALERFGVSPEQAVFIDDVADNVKAAHDIGITAIQFVSAGQLTENLAQLGID